MHRPLNQLSWGTHKGSGEKRGTRKKYAAFAAALAPLLMNNHSQAANTVYTYTPTNTNTDLWSAGTHWSATPLSAANTELAFGTGFAFTGGFANVNTDDNAGAFNLNAMDLNGTGPSGTAATIAINASAGSSLNFTGTAPAITLNASNGSGGLTYNVNAPINLGATVLVNTLGTATFNFTGNITGSAGLSFADLTSTLASTTIGLSGTNSYTGVTTVAAGNPTQGGASNTAGGSTITVNVSGNQTGANGGWSIIPAGGTTLPLSIGTNPPNNFGLGIVNFLTGSQIAVGSASAFQVGSLTSANGTTQTVNFAGTASNAGFLYLGRAAVFNVSSGGVWNQSGGMNMNTPNGGVSTALNILSGGVFTYNGSTPITLNPATSSGGSSIINLTGTFNTSAGFTSSGSSGAGLGVLNMSGGSLFLNSASTITNLTTAPVQMKLIASTNSTINTNGSAGNNIIGGNINNATGTAGSLTKTGLGTLTLAGIDTYSGTTNISAGTLAISGTTSLPATTIVGFINNTGTATLDFTGLTQSVAGLVFGNQNGSAGTNTVFIKGTSLTTSPATINFSPFNASGNLLVDMTSLGSFTYNNPTGNFNVSMGVNAGANGSSTVLLASNNDVVTSLTLSVGNVGSQTLGNGSQSTLVLGTNATINTGTLNVGTSKSRGGGTLNAGSGTLTVAGLSGGLANLNIGQNDSNSVPLDTITSVMDTSAGTLNAQLGAVIIGQSAPSTNFNISRGVTINAGLKMGAGTLSANSLTIGLLNNAINTNVSAGSVYYQEVVNGSFNITGGVATIPSITLGTSNYNGNFSSTAGLTSLINSTITLNTGSVLNSSNIAVGTIATPAQGTLTVNPVINWNDGTITNIAGSNLNISGVAINLSGATANHALNISSGQVANISSVINGSTDTLTLGGPGTVNLLSSNLYAGPTVIGAGTLVAGAFNALSPNSGINISGGTLDASGFANTIASLTEQTGGTLDLGYGNLLTVTGAANVTGALNLVGTAGTLPEALMNYSSGSTITFSNTPSNIPSGDTLLVTATSLELVSTTASGPANLNWTNASETGTWDTTNANFNTSTGATVAYSDTSNTSLSAGDNVAFTDNNNGNYNVSISATVHPTSTTVNNSGGTYVFNGSGGIAGPGGLTKLGAGALSLYVSNAYTGGTNISAGTVSLFNAHALPAFSNLNIGSTANVTATTLGGAYALQIGALSVTPGGTIDLQNNAATIRGSSLSSVFGLVQSGFNGSSGAWTGTGITSSTAAAHPLTALGVIINDTGANTGGATGTPIYNTSSGASTVDGDILVKYTYYGDANLSGSVDASDYSLIDNGFINHLTGWYNGDFNYDGVVNGSDYTLIDNAFNTQGASLADELASPSATATAEIADTSAVPEPASLSVLSLGLAGLLGRRRRAH